MKWRRSQVLAAYFCGEGPGMCSTLGMRSIWASPGPSHGAFACLRGEEAQGGRW